MPATTATLIGLAFPAEVAQFCHRNHLLASLEAAVRLAGESFDPLDELKVELESDPEMGEEYLVIDVVARGTLDSVLERHRRYTQRWVAQAPAGRQHLIRLVFDVRPGDDEA
jgi:hypothetical protein